MKISNAFIIFVTLSAGCIGLQEFKGGVHSRCGSDLELSSQETEVCETCSDILVTVAMDKTGGSISAIKDRAGEITREAKSLAETIYPADSPENITKACRKGFDYAIKSANETMNFSIDPSAQSSDAGRSVTKNLPSEGLRTLEKESAKEKSGSGG